MKKKVGIALLALISIGLVGSYAVKAIEENRVYEVLKEEVQLPICTLSNKEIVRLEVYEQEVTTFEKQGDHWINAELPDLPYDQELMNEFVETLKNMTSIETLRYIENLSEYGINEDAKMITIYDSENNSQTFKLGHILTDENKIYVSIDDDELLYSVPYDTVSKLFTKTSSLTSKVLTLPNIEAINQIEITSEDKKPIILNMKDDVWYLSDYYKEGRLAVEELVGETLDQIYALDKESYVGIITEAEDYGISKPSLTIKLNQEITLQFGRRENGMVYIRFNEEPYVYRINEERIKVFDNIDPFNLIVKEVYIPNVDEVIQIELVNPQATYTLDLSKNDQGVSISEFNEVMLDAGQTQEVIENIVKSICIEALLQNPQIEVNGERKAEITVTYTLKDGNKKLIELIPYDIHFYILRLDGQIEFAVGKEQVTQLFNKMAQILK